MTGQRRPDHGGRVGDVARGGEVQSEAIPRGSEVPAPASGQQQDAARTHTEARAHILEGLKIALDHLDEVIKLIRASKTTPEAREGLMREFGLSQLQAQAILDMRLQKLAGLERKKIEDELHEVQELIAELESLLKNPKKMMELIKKEIREVIEGGKAHGQWCGGPGVRLRGDSGPGRWE